MDYKNTAWTQRPRSSHSLKSAADTTWSTTQSTAEHDAVEEGRNPWVVTFFTKNKMLETSDALIPISQKIKRGRG